MILGNVLMGLDSCNRTELTTIEQSLKIEEHTASVALELKQIYSSSIVALIFKKIKIVYWYLYLLSSVILKVFVTHLAIDSFDSIRYFHRPLMKLHLI